MTPLLTITGLSKRFGGLVAVHDVTFDVKEREIASVIGPNGAGKTTFFNLLTGIFRADAGEIRFRGRNLLGLRPDQIAAAGVARTFQNIRLFGAMTTLENVLVGQHANIATSYLDALLRNRAFLQRERAAIERGRFLLDYVQLGSKAAEIAHNLSYGEQRKLEIARALAANPALVLLDEPSAGMNPRETGEMRDLIHRIRDELGISVVLIEHDMPLVMSVSDRVIVLDHGEKLCEGLPAEIRSNPRVVEAYLGRSVAAKLAKAHDALVEVTQ
ncbi:MAG: ABC transporter ATP-binding protein [Hyphomicrobiales bacterium]|nr:ABC transporter ATP-binding protein [Hyphomicrobiales bacterium]